MAADKALLVVFAVSWHEKDAYDRQHCLEQENGDEGAQLEFAGELLLLDQVLCVGGFISNQLHLDRPALELEYEKNVQTHHHQKGIERHKGVEDAEPFQVRLDSVFVGFDFLEVVICFLFGPLAGDVQHYLGEEDEDYAYHSYKTESAEFFGYT